MWNFGDEGSAAMRKPLIVVSVVVRPMMSIHVSVKKADFAAVIPC